MCAWIKGGTSDQRTFKFRQKENINVDTTTIATTGLSSQLEKYTGNCLPLGNQCILLVNNCVHKKVFYLFCSSVAHIFNPVSLHASHFFGENP